MQSNIKKGKNQNYKYAGLITVSGNYYQKIIVQIMNSYFLVIQYVYFKKICRFAMAVIYSLKMFNYV